MRKFVILLSLLFLIVIDLGSKAWISSLTPTDYCVYDQMTYISQYNNPWDRSLGGYFPALECDEKRWDMLDRYTESPRIRLWSDILSIEPSHNEGIAFSLPITGLPLQILTILLIFGLVYFYITEEYPKSSRLLDAAYTLIFAWALSHGYERIFVWHVVDFISVRYFAILNFADIFISIGAFLIVLSYVYHRREHR